jgi:putative acetyltransferase
MKFSPPVLAPWRLREATAQDASAIATVWRAAWCSVNPNVTSVAPADHWLARVRHDFTPPHTVVVAADNHTVFGFAAVHVPHAYLYQLHTLPSLQRQGIGTALLQWAMQRLPSAWTLHVATSNAAAQRFYERRGLLRGAVSVDPVTGRERVAYGAMDGGA